VSQDLRPRITLRASDVAEMYRDAPVRDVKIYIAEQDWEPFLSVAYDGMEIPVRVEGEPDFPVIAILTGADYANKAITVVI
jgi:hypothetical protein